MYFIHKNLNFDAHEVYSYHIFVDVGYLINDPSSVLAFPTPTQTKMATKCLTQCLPCQCPAPLCGKGFHNLSQIQKHLAMSTWCGLFVQKILDTQSQTFNKSPAISKPPRVETNIHEPFPYLDSWQTDVNVGDPNFEEDLIDSMEDETSLANRRKVVHAVQKQTVECHTPEQYFECKLLRILNKVNAHHYLFQSIMEWAHNSSVIPSALKPTRENSCRYLTYHYIYLHQLSASQGEISQPPDWFGFQFQLEIHLSTCSSMLQHCTVSR